MFLREEGEKAAMRLSFLKGASFGLTSGIITTLGLMTGLEAGSGSKSVILGGIFTIAIADALSDSLGMHVSEESAAKGEKDIWEATFATFLAKFIFALTFAIPILLLPLQTAMWVAIIWGLLLLSGLSYWLARKNGSNPLHAIGEHLFIAVLVIVLTTLVGRLVAHLVG
jgi:VIT1/CCC1 family predicted Fe2+/Mn2+ transporter